MRAQATPRILRSVRNKKWTISLALAELVDNSFGELRGNASTIWISWEPKFRQLTVVDNGRGMDDVIDLFTLGKGSASGRGDIGFYGVGGSEALLWLGDKVEITTLRNRRVAHGQANWAVCLAREEYPDINNTWRPASPNNCHPFLLSLKHGTMIQMMVRNGINVHTDIIQERLSRLFGLGLRSGREIIWVTYHSNGTNTEMPLQAWNPGPLEEVIETGVTIGDELAAHVRAGLVEGLSIANSKLSVNFSYRQVKETTAGFGKPVQGAMGNIDLSPEWLEHLTTTKDDIREESRDREDALMAQIALALEPLVKKLEKSKLHTIFTNLKMNLELRFKRGFVQLAPKPVPEFTPEPEPDPDPHPPRPYVPPPKQRFVTAIEPTPVTDAQLAGLLCEAKIDPAHNKIVAFVNVDHWLIQEALKSEPVNRMLFEYVVTEALAAELLEQNLIVESGLLSADELLILEEKCHGKLSNMHLHVHRLITDSIIEAKVH